MFDHEGPVASDSLVTDGQNSSTVPTGLEQLLGLAHDDPTFRDLLLRKRAETADNAGIQLNASEKRILQAVSAHQLATMINKMPPYDPSRRGFLAKTAAAAAVLLGGAAIGGTTTSCIACGGDRGDIPPERPRGERDRTPSKPKPGQ